MSSAHCHVCDSPGRIVRESRELAIGHRRARIPHEFFRCPECGEEWLTPEQMDTASAEASRRIREREGLLQAEEILAIRESLRLTQEQFEKLLGVGPKTVVRWERGTVFQNRSTDTLLRLLRGLPEARRMLGEWRGISIPGSGSPQ